MEALGYYAKDKDSNLFKFEWSMDNGFYIRDHTGKLVSANPGDYEIVEIAILVG